MPRRPNREPDLRPTGGKPAAFQMIIDQKFVDNWSTFL